MSSRKELRQAYLDSICGLSSKQISRLHDLSDDLRDIPPHAAAHHARECWKAYVSSCQPELFADIK